jgi:outer membrane lipoprotein-sorting protein
MNRFPVLAYSLLSFAAFTAAATSQAQAALSASQIVDKNIAARGGMSAWHAVQTMTMEGTLDAGGKVNHALPFVMRLKRPHESRLEITFKEQTSVQVFDGAQGWKVRPFLNRNEMEPFTKTEANSAESTDELDGPLIDYAAKGTKVALVGNESVEGHPAYKLKLTLRSGEQRNLWIDAGSFLELKADGAPRVLDGRKHNVAIYYRDYKSEHGLVVPHTLETAVQGVKSTYNIQISRLAVNETFSDSLFRRPQLAAAGAPGLKRRP